MVDVRVLRLPYPAKGTVEERGRGVAKATRYLESKWHEDSVVISERLVVLCDVGPVCDLLGLPLVG